MEDKRRKREGIRLILQNDIRIKSSFINESGCAEMCINWYLNKLKDVLMSPEIIVSLHEKRKSAGYLSDKEEVYFQVAFKGTSLDDVKYHYEPKDYALKSNEFAIGEWYNPRTDFIHFTAVDCENGVYICTYDPLGESVTVKEGYLKSLRVFTRK